MGKIAQIRTALVQIPIASYSLTLSHRYLRCVYLNSWTHSLSLLFIPKTCKVDFTILFVLGCASAALALILGPVTIILVCKSRKLTGVLISYAATLVCSVTLFAVNIPEAKSLCVYCWILEGKVTLLLLCHSTAVCLRIRTETCFCRRIVKTKSLSFFCYVWVDSEAKVWIVIKEGTLITNDK